MFSGLRLTLAAVVLTGSAVAAYFTGAASRDDEVRALSQEVATYQTALQASQQAVEELEKRNHALVQAERLARTIADQIREREAALAAELRQFKEGTDCDPTDADCAIDFINGLLRDADPADGDGG